MVISTASVVRNWLLSSASSTAFLDKEFSYKEVAEDTRVENHHAVCAELSKMREKGFLLLIGKKKRLGSKGGSSSFIYKLNPEADLEKLSSMLVKSKPRDHNRIISRPMEGRVHAKPPGGWGMLEHTSENLELPSASIDDDVIQECSKYDVANELVNIAIDVEERGVTREAGLRLLKAADHIFRSAK